MSEEAAPVIKAPEASPAIAEGVKRYVTGNTDEMKVFDDAVRFLPLHVVMDLLSIGVCSRCILRLFGIQVPTDSSLVQRSLLPNILGERAEMEKYVEPEFCSICLGILQFRYRDEKEILAKRESAHDLAVTIADFVKKEGHQIDSYSLEVSMPSIVLENEETVWVYVERKYGSESWFQERPFSGRVSAKDALKFALTDQLETLLDVKCSQSSFRIRFTYSHAKVSKLILNHTERDEGCKRRKIDTDSGLEIVKDEVVVASDEHIVSSVSEEDLVTGNNSNGLRHSESSGTCMFRPEKITEPCHLECLCYRTPVYLGGRYLKFSRNVSQTRWIIDDERKGEASIEEIIGGNILPLCQGDNYKFHAAGREDIDVRMLGSGRPFLVEIQNARRIPSELFVKEIETRINNFETKLVRVKNLKVVGSQGWDLMREGEAEKQKQYAALVWISRTLQDEDLKTISSLKEMKIMQRTPVRVLHRRSPLEREKIIHWMKIEKVAGSSQYFLLHLCTQAGTYIKEFVHGDLGRTDPSIGSILGCRAEILQLDVTDVKMDCFLTE